MPPNFVTFGLLTLFLSTPLAFSSPTEISSSPGIPLNSERIQSQFGSYGIEILKQTRNVRISNLYSTHGGKRVCRTLALVHFAESIPRVLQREHDEIVNGGSLGAVLKSSGWSITKRTTHIGAMRHDGFRTLSERLMKSPQTRVLAVHLYDLSVTRSDHQVHYATIAEIHHPEYLTTSKLKQIYQPSSVQEWHRPDKPSASLIERVQQEISRLVLEHQELDLNH